MAAELGSGVNRVVSYEKTSSYGKPGIAHNVGIADKAEKAIPVRKFNLAFGAINDRFAKGYRKADRSIENLVVVGKVIYIAAEIVCVKTKLAEETLGEAEFEVIPMRGFHWEAKDVGVEHADLGRTGEKNILERGRLKHAIVGGVDDQAGGGKIARHRNARAKRVLIYDELIVVPAQAGIDGPFAEVDKILDES